MTDDVYAIPNRIKFANSTMLEKERNFGEKRLHYKLKTWKIMGTFDIMNNISEYISLVQVIDSFDNANHSVSVVGK